MQDQLRDQLQEALTTSITIERELGGGGMSRVFLATDRSLDRPIVIKTLPPELASEVGLERFRREIEVAARLHHPHVVALISAGIAHGSPYYTMPFVQGETLRDRLQRGPLPVAEAVQILREIADALTYAHGRGVVHRDIKPENILIAHRHALVTDFGVAKAFAPSDRDAVAGGSIITQLGVTVGTPAYMAPEQISADPSIDHRVDLYSLGILGYEMLVGTPPYHGMPPSKMLAAHVSGTPLPIHQLRSGIPADLSALLMRCLAKAPEARPATAAEVLAELEMIGAETAPKRRRRLSRRSVAVAVILIVAILGLGRLLLPRDLRAMLTVLAYRPAVVLRPNRVIVSPLRNETGDSTFDHFGDFASSQVSDALTRLTPLTVIDGRSAVVNDRIIRRLPMLSWFRGTDRAIADQTGAGMVVTGAFYRDGNLLRIRAKITDFASGKIIQPLGDISGPADSMQSLVTKFSRRVYGTMAQALDTNITTPFGAFGNPPSLEAYTETMNGFLAYVSFDTSFVGHYRQAIALDSEYPTPVVLLALGGTFRDRRALAESSVVRAMRLADRMTPAEAVLIEHVRANLRADAAGVERTARQLLATVPGSLEIPLLVAGAELSAGDPTAAVDALRHTFPDRGLNLFTSYYWRNLGEAQHQLGAHASALETFRAGAKRFGSDARLAEWEATELIDLGRERELDAVIQRGRSDADRLSIAAGALDALGARGKQEAAKESAERWIARFGSTPADAGRQIRYDAARLRGAAQQWDSVRALLAPLLHGPNDLLYRDALTLHAIAALHRGDLETARRADSLLAGIVDRYDYGRADMHRAEISAQRGNVPRAEELLTAAMAKGYGLQYTHWPIERDPWLVALAPTTWFDARRARATRR